MLKNSIEKQARQEKKKPFNTLKALLLLTSSPITFQPAALTTRSLFHRSLTLHNHFSLGLRV